MKHERCWPSRWWLLRSIGHVHHYFSLSFCSPFLSSHISWINPPCNFSCHVSQQFSLKQTPAPPLFSGLLSLACYLWCWLQSRRLRFYDYMMWEVAARNRNVLFVLLLAFMLFDRRSCFGICMSSLSIFSSYPGGLYSASVCYMFLYYADLLCQRRVGVGYIGHDLAPILGKQARVLGEHWFHCLLIRLIP